MLQIKKVGHDLNERIEDVGRLLIQPFSLILRDLHQKSGTKAL